MAQNSLPKPSLFKSKEAKGRIVALYNKKLESLNITYTEKDIETSYGRTHIVIAGDTSLPPVILVHGINSGSPASLELVKDLTDRFCIYGIDILGQPNKSEDRRLPFYDSSYAGWMMSVMDSLAMPKATFIGVSYGAYIVERLMVYKPERILKTIFIVPAGIVGAPAFKSVFKVFRPINKYKKDGDEDDLMDFMDAVYTFPDSDDIAQQKAVLNGFKADNRLPPMIIQETAKSYTGPVYLIAADKDILFPAKPLIEQANKVFKDLRNTHTLRNCKHIPGQDQIHIIQSLVETWLKEEI